MKTIYTFLVFTACLFPLTGWGWGQEVSALASTTSSEGEGIQVVSMRNLPLQRDTVDSTQSDVVKSHMIVDIPSVAKPAKVRKKMFGPGITKVKSGDSIKSMGLPMWRISFTLFILILAIFGTIYGLKKLSKKFAGIDIGETMQIVSRLQIDQKNSVILLRIHEEELLLGVGSNQINLLTKYSSLNESELNDFGIAAGDEASISPADTERRVGNVEFSENNGAIDNIKEAIRASFGGPRFFGR